MILPAIEPSAPAGLVVRIYDDRGRHLASGYVYSNDDDGPYLVAGGHEWHIATPRVTWQWSVTA